MYRSLLDLPFVRLPDEIRREGGSPGGKREEGDPLLCDQSRLRIDQSRLHMSKVSCRRDVDDPLLHTSCCCCLHIKLQLLKYAEESITTYTSGAAAATSQY